MMASITDPEYISEHMLDKIVKEKFQNSANDRAVRDQAINFLRMFRAAQAHHQVLVDILHASKASRQESKEAIAEIGFVMGLQFGFELALSFPPLRSN